MHLRSKVSVLAHTVIANVDDNQVSILHHSQACRPFHFAPVRINHRIKAARVQPEHLNERLGLFCTSSQQKAVIVTDQTAVTAFALALRKDFTNKVTGGVEHLNTRISHQNVARGGHGHR